MKIENMERTREGEREREREIEMERERERGRASEQSNITAKNHCAHKTSRP